MPYKNIYQTGPARLVHNETIGTVYVRVPMKDGDRDCAMIYPNLTLEEARLLQHDINTEREKEQ